MEPLSDWIGPVILKSRVFYPISFNIIYRNIICRVLVKRKYLHTRMSDKAKCIPQVLTSMTQVSNVSREKILSINICSKSSSELIFFSFSLAAKAQLA